MRVIQILAVLLVSGFIPLSSMNASASQHESHGNVVINKQAVIVINLQRRYGCGLNCQPEADRQCKRLGYRRGVIFDTFRHDPRGSTVSFRDFACTDLEARN